jgi:peptidoglycan/LPS O-acetylase OafA/YrhL
MTRPAEIEVSRVFDRPFSQALHGLRGIASLTVFVNHFANLLTRNDPILGPLNHFGGGLSSVALFFVMSGTVLGISLKRFQLQPMIYAEYAARRALRLLPMVVVSCTIGFAFSRSGLHAADPRIFGESFFQFYTAPLSIKLLFFSWTGLYAGADPPMWSIYIEIIASALLPFFVLASRGIWGNLALCVSLLALSFATSGANGHFARNFWPVYMVNFAVGLLLCHFGQISALVNRLSRLTVSILTIGLYALLMCGRTALNLGEHGVALGNLFDLTVASALVVLLLERRPEGGSKGYLNFLGDISYPLYLLHWPVLCMLLAGSVKLLGADLVETHFELWAASMFVGSLTLLLALSIASHHWIERPAIAFGRKITRWSMLRRTPPVAVPAQTLAAGKG